MKLLLDQHISPRLIDRLAGKGVFAQFVGHLGRSRMSDPDLWRYAFTRDQIVVTANARDFLLLASRSELHPGLILLRALDLSADQQWQHLDPAIDRLSAEGRDLTNHVIEVWGIGRFDIWPLPPP